jgi:hypothetical protein
VSVQVRPKPLGMSVILLIIAVILFVVAAIGLKVDVSLVDLGLAFFAAAFIFG